MFLPEKRKNENYHFLFKNQTRLGFQRKQAFVTVILQKIFLVHLKRLSLKSFLCASHLQISDLLFALASGSTTGLPANYFKH